MRVLLIDDEPMVRKIVRKMLERDGHEVAEAENGRLGIEQLEASRFDLLLTDIIMPEMEGIETLMMVRERFPGIVIIAMSGGGRTGNLDFLNVAERLGASATLQKPFTFAALAEAINQSCATSKVA